MALYLLVKNSNEHLDQFIILPTMKASAAFLPTHAPRHRASASTALIDRAWGKSLISEA